ncbi:MAG: hypothetical protein JXQ76_09015 [Campylobacterales bacterium]|nr:hypothetical protein [Campylobacterales bacterium]
MMKFWFSLFLSLTLSWAGYKVGDRLEIKTLNNQLDKPISLANAKKIIVAFDKASYYDVDKFLQTQPNFLKTHNIAFINDISAVPSTILSLFIKPAMKKKPYDILLLRDLQASKKLDFQEGKITLYTLKNGKITQIEYIDSLKIGSYFQSSRF